MREGKQFFEIYVSRGIVLIRTAMRVFRVTPRRVKRVNGEVLTPDMGVVVTMRRDSLTPFVNGAPELVDAYRREYGFDYKKACCSANDFTWEGIG